MSLATRALLPWEPGVIAGRAMGASPALEAVAIGGSGGAAGGLLE